MTIMNTQFNHDLFWEDVQHVKEILPKFVKSFGKDQKKIQDRPIGIIEEHHVRFQLLLTDWGRAKVIKIGIALAALLLLYLAVLRFTDLFFTLVIVLPAIWYLWKWVFDEPKK